MSKQSITDYLDGHVSRTLDSYRAQPERLEEDWRVEQSVISGGYGHRQVIELIQNGADEIKRAGGRGKVHVVLTKSALYCANEGRSLTENGLRALLMANMSDKVDDEIGRFGLGFKSILNVCDSPEFFSDAISFRFGGAQNLATMREIVAKNALDERALPRLRTAELCGLAEAASKDSTLSNLLQWATSVIRLPLKRKPALLVEELEEFPAEFLLFSPHVSELRFQILEKHRHMGLKPLTDGFELIDAEKKPRRFKVFRRKVQVEDLSEEARADMDERLKQRRSLPIAWAVPIDSSVRERGRFWAFSPTQSLTAVQGIINAPWKTNSDRQNLVEEGGNEFNAELARHIANLISENLVNVALESDPAKHIDVLPLVETNGNTDEVLVGEIRRALRRSAWLPSQCGKHLKASETTLRPVAVVEAMAELSELLGKELHSLVSVSAETEMRRKILTRFQISEMALAKWLEGLEYDSTHDFSRSALLIADMLLEQDSGLLSNIKLAKIVLTENGELVPPNPTTLVLPSERETDGVSVLCEQLATDKQILRILQRRFSIESATTNSSFLAHASKRSSFSHGHTNRPNEYWERFWQLLRCIDSSAPEIRKICLDPKHPLRVKSLAGTFESIFTCIYVPGLAALGGTSRAKTQICDEEYHERDFELFEQLQIVGCFELPDGAAPSSIYNEYTRSAVEKYREGQKGAKQASGCKFKDNYYHAGICLIKKLYGYAAVFLTEEIGKLADYDRKWTMFYDRATKKVNEQVFESPLKYAIEHYGVVQTSLGPRKLCESLTRRYKEFSGFLPVVDTTNGFEALIADEDSVLKRTVDIFSFAPTEPPTDRAIGMFYGLAASISQSKPDEIWAECSGEWLLCSPQEVFVVANCSQMELLQTQNIPAVLCCNTEHRLALCKHWGLAEPAVELRFDPCDSSVQVKQLFPPLAGNSVGEVTLQPCTRLLQEFRSTQNGLLTTAVAHGLQDDVVYYVTTPAQSLADLLDIIQAHFPNADLVRARDHVDSLHVERLKLEIKQTSELAEKIVLAVGEENLACNIPSRHLLQFKDLRAGSPTALELASMSLAVYGPDILKVYSNALISRGLNAPRQWAGRSRESEFVRALGFPDSFAGASRSERPAFEDVTGPVVLRPLHDFQKRMKSQVLDLLNSPQPDRAAMSLPTGAGKTRVAVQSAIEWINSRSEPTQVLWVAQSDELCEQAVQTWKQAWSALGGRSKQLRICRFWGNTGNQIELKLNEHCVVVGTYQTLKNRLEESNFAWVYDQTQFVIIDEAHGAITSSYTAILKRLGIARNATRIPLLGLTATPFRGSDNAEESFRLAFRFNKQLLTSGSPTTTIFHELLQKQGIIAQVEHDVLEGSSLGLTDEELQDLETFDRLPASAESRLAKDSIRNNRIVDKILSLPSDWPILLFATSRDHAEDLAVRLSVEGVSAQCISGESSITQRRSAIDDFNAGKIRVLTNYGVLTTGFDAPAVRAVFITRPIFSRVLYQQVIGRGLRGPENGGKEKCLIVNVADNVSQYGHRLAFEEEHYWDANSSLQQQY